MFAAFLTTILFSCSIICAHQSSRHLGPVRANLARMILAAVFLGIWAHAFGKGLHERAFPIFFWSGIVGFGLGDFALFQALPRLGSRLTILLAQCLAAPMAAFIEWIWLGIGLNHAQILSGAMILGGVTLALSSPRKKEAKHCVNPWGIFFGVMAAAGQAAGAVLSRKGYQLLSLHHESLDGGTAAYHRILGGLAVTAVISMFLWNHDRRSTRVSWRAWGWVAANSLFGPALGVACYQWALAICASGIVLPIVATTPLVVMPLAWWIEGDRPPPHALGGALVAVFGAAWLSLSS